METEEPRSEVRGESEGKLKALFSPSCEHGPNGGLPKPREAHSDARITSDKSPTRVCYQIKWCEQHSVLLDPFP